MIRITKKNFFFLLMFSFLLFNTGCKKTKQNLYEQDLTFLNKQVNVKIYTNSQDKADKIFNDIQTIYNNYEFAIKEGNSLSNKKISNELYNLIETGLKWHDKSNGLININKGNLVDLWNKYKKDKSIPSSSELKRVEINIDNIKLNNKYLTGSFNLNFDDFIYGQADKDIKNYLNEMHIKYYFINASDHILVGSNYDRDNYNILLSNPFNEEINTITINNKYIVTKSIYYDSYEYNDSLYSNIVNPITKELSNNMISVTVISDDPLEGDILATILFMSDYDDGYRFANEYNIQAIWYFYDENGNEIVKKTKDFR